MTTSLPESVLVEAATVVARALELGDQATAGEWQVDDGDTVIAVELSGGSRLGLAVATEVAEQLAADPERLIGALSEAAAMLGRAVGVELSIGAIDSAAAPTWPAPVQCVEIRDGAALAGLLACAIEVAEPIAETDEALPAGSVTTEPFTPTRFAEPNSATGNPALAGLGPLALLQDIDMEITVELGRTTMPIRDLLALQPGMVVEIDRVAGAPIDVLVNGHRFACGEVVVIDEEFGLRITEIVGAGS